MHQLPQPWVFRHHLLLCLCPRLRPHLCRTLPLAHVLLNSDRDVDDGMWSFEVVKLGFLKAGENFHRVNM
jgi:hypothetical protein